MDTLLVGYVLLFGASAVVCLASVPRALAIQHPGTREGLVGLLLAVALWSVGYAGYLLAPTAASQTAFYILGFVFAFVAVGAWLYFCAAYTGRPPQQAPYRRLALGVFVLFAALKLTNPLHNLYFTTEPTTEPFPHLAIQHGLLYWVVLGLSYAVIAVGFFMLLERFYYTGTDSRPLVALMGLTGLPAIATILGNHIEWLLPLMYEPPGVALFAVGTLFVYNRRFEAIHMTGETDKPALFLDTDGCIRDYNHAAKDIFPALRSGIGKPVRSVIPALTEQHPDGEILTVTRGEETRQYEMSTTPFMSGEVTTGQLLTITDVTDRESYRRQLEERTEQLEALNRVVRHDIRNDMAVIFAWAEMLEDHVDENGADALERILRKSQHVIDLTELSRDFVESISGDGSTEVKPIELHTTLQTELTAVRDSFPDAHFQVTDGIPEVSVRGNEMLSSVFRNLLENAVRHNDAETPKITVTCVDAADVVRIRVADNGPGIPDAQKEQIFGKGEKGLDSPGSGIGLYLVDTLVEQFGGAVWVEDNDPEGAVFVVELQKST